MDDKESGKSVPLNDAAESKEIALQVNLGQCVCTASLSRMSSLIRGSILLLSDGISKYTWLPLNVHVKILHISTYYNNIQMKDEA